MNRTAECKRETNETSVFVGLKLDGTGTAEVESGLPFLDHMLQALALHSGIDLTVRASGDLDVDAHHTIEDIGLVLGQALRESVPERKKIARFGWAYVPMDEALTRVVVDVSGRPFLGCRGLPETMTAGGINCRLFREFLQGMVNNAGITVHVDVLQGAEVHHVMESVFKAAGKALAQAFRFQAGTGDVPSSKGTIE